LDIKARIIQIIYSVIDAVNLEKNKDDQISKTLDSVLSGPGSKLDSMDILNFIVNLEQKLEEAFSKEFNLFSEETLFENDNPLQSIEKLTVFIETQVSKSS